MPAPRECRNEDPHEPHPWNVSSSHGWLYYICNGVKEEPPSERKLMRTYELLYDPNGKEWSIIYKDPQDPAWAVYLGGLDRNTAVELVEALTAKAAGDC